MVIKKYIIHIILIFSLIGLIDASYLTWEHFSNTTPPCTIGYFSDCGKVLKSKYSEIFGIPVALFGAFYYLTVLLISLTYLKLKNKHFLIFLFLITPLGLLASIYLVILQLFIIKSICPYCMLSALTSTLIFIASFIYLDKERKLISIYKIQFLYKYFLRPILFRIDSEKIHNLFTKMGSIMGKTNFIPKIIGFFAYQKNESLKQKILGVEFENPIGLAAGFDYDANLTRVTKEIGFGFHTIGTVTNMEYQGNPKPRLGRLPKSKSLLVNKGFKNVGVYKIIQKLRNKRFSNAVGISIRRTNSKKLKTQKQSIEDIIKAFKKIQKSNINFSYYELNISCPNLFGNITFYPPKNLEDLLVKVDLLKLKKPLFVKMPITKTNEETLEMLRVISKHSPKGVIFGNLQTNGDHKSINPNEAKKYSFGNFSGKPTFEDSNEKIALAYKHYKDRFVIIGCGGVFNAEDAYKKIKLGASLIQLITGLIYEGPFLPAKINSDLVKLLKNDGYKNISEAIGKNK